MNIVNVKCTCGQCMICDTDLMCCHNRKLPSVATGTTPRIHSDPAVEKIKKNIEMMDAYREWYNEWKMDHGHGEPTLGEVWRACFKWNNEQPPTPQTGRTYTEGGLDISPERAQFLLNLRDALTYNDQSEAWHWLAKFYNPPLDKYSDELWIDIEALAATEDHEKYKPPTP
jgi:hypothetical protein